MIYHFGADSYKQMRINAETVEEAKREFAFSCSDISLYTIKGNPFWREILTEPYGFTDGKPNEEFNLPNFYQRVPFGVQEQNSHGGQSVREIGMITAQEIELILATPHNVLLPSSSGMAGEVAETTESVRPSRGMMMLQQQGRSIQLQFRNKQLELLSLKAKSALQLAEYENIRSQADKEQRKIQEKINILQTYTGIGKDLVKVRSGKASDSKKITVFQALRYMREDIELLSDFEEFDFSTLDAFDAFLAENYTKLLPVDLSIQAFAISKFPILYQNVNLFGQKIASTDKRNEQVFILIRNGENVYRMFNKYSINGKLFHSEDALDQIIKTEGIFSSSDMDAIDGKPVEFWEIKGNTNTSYSYRTVHIPSASAFYPDLDTGILDREFERCKAKFDAEIARRQRYIDENGLSDILTTTSWRWGKYIGKVKHDYFENYHKTFKRMYMKEAYKTKDYALCGTLSCSFSALSKRFDVDAKDGDNIYDGEQYLYDYETSHGNGKYEVQRFNPLTGAAIQAEVIRCDDEFMRYGFFEEAREDFMKRVWEKSDELHLKNFHAVAILQNILDNRIIFPDHEADFITGDGMESIHRVYDDENMIQSSESKERAAPTDLINTILSESIGELKIGQSCHLLQSYEMRTSYSGNRYTKNHEYKYTFDTKSGDKPFVATRMDVISCQKNSVTAEGMISEWKRDNYRAGIWAGDPKIGKMTFKSKDNVFGSENTLVAPCIIQKYERDIKDMMGRREFRETHYLSYGLYFKELLKLRPNKG